MLLASNSTASTGGTGHFVDPQNDNDRATYLTFNFSSNASSHEGYDYDPSYQPGGNQSGESSIDDGDSGVAKLTGPLA